MGLYDLKEFLTFEDVADYLKDKGIYDFDLSNESDKKRLKNFLIDLAIEREINIVFDYAGLAYPLDLYNIQNIDLLSIDFKVINCKLYANKRLLNNWLKDKDLCINLYHHLSNIESMGDLFIPYNHDDFKDKVEPKTAYILKSDEIITVYASSEKLKNGVLSQKKAQQEFIRQLLFVKSELDFLFNCKEIPNNQSLQAENDRLKAEIERLTTELNKKPTTPAKEGQGDSLLILGAVMDCLDNETIRNYSQTVLIGKIREKYPNVTGLSESTISKKISESKKYLQKHK